MPQDSTDLSLLGAYESGYIQANTQKQVVDNFKLAGLFPRVITNDKQVTITEGVPLGEFDKEIVGEEKVRGITMGATPRKIRTKLRSPKGMKLDQSEIMMEIEQKQLEDDRLDLNTLISNISYSLAKDIDQMVYDCAIEYATEVSDSKIIGKWTANDIETIVADTVRMKNKLRPKPYIIDQFALGAEAQTEVEVKSAKLPTKWQLPINGYQLEDVVRLGSTNFSWGGADMDPSELLAFSSQYPAMQIFYMNYNNPRIHSVPTVPGYEATSPYINVMMFDNADTEPEPITTLRFSINMGAYALEEGDRMLHITNVLS